MFRVVLFSTAFYSFPLVFSLAVCQYVDMVCIVCGGQTHVVNSRHQKRSNQIWRRRACSACSAVFTSEEAVRYDTAWVVAGQNDSITPFSRDRLFLSVYKSCAHRDNAVADASELTETIMRRLASLTSGSTVRVAHIYEVTSVTLSRFDSLAGNYYSATHR